VVEGVKGGLAAPGGLCTPGFHVQTETVCFVAVRTFLDELATLDHTSVVEEIRA